MIKISKLVKTASHKKVLTNSKKIITVLANHIGERNIANPANLLAAKTFIIESVKSLGGNPLEHVIKVKKQSTSNIDFEIKSKKNPKKIILIGAHYDTIAGSKGANDNGTGIAALLEIYRLLKDFEFNYTIRFVAFTLEEPPFFGTTKMGSMLYAKKCAKNREQIKLMISLDMLGCGGKLVKQKYPFKFMQETYPKYGNFLCIAALPSASKHAFLWKKIFNNISKVDSHEIIAPASIRGIHHSDHFSFHQHGFPAILLTDTGAYRSKVYHTSLDLPEKINFNFLANNILTISQTVKELATLSSFFNNKIF